MYLKTLFRACNSIGMHLVSKSIREYGVVVLIPRCLLTKDYCIFSMSFHVYGDMLPPHIVQFVSHMPQKSCVLYVVFLCHYCCNNFQIVNIF
eukprot:c44863_g1_i1 orf=2-274(-)